MFMTKSRKSPSESLEDFLLMVYATGFSPRMMRIKNRIIATTSNMWMNPPRTWNPINPSSHKIRRITAIVVSIEVNLG